MASMFLRKEQVNRLVSKSQVVQLSQQQMLDEFSDFFMTF